MNSLRKYTLFCILLVSSCQTTVYSPVPKPQIPTCIVGEDNVCLCQMGDVSYTKDCLNHLAITTGELGEMIGYERELISSCKEWKK